VALPAGCIVHHSANEGVRGGKRGMIDGARRKAMGQVAGWPDITILAPSGAFFIEVKAEGGRLSPSQKELHDRMRALGFEVGVARSIDDAREMLDEWGVCHSDGSTEIPMRGIVT